MTIRVDQFNDDENERLIREERADAFKMMGRKKNHNCDKCIYCVMNVATKFQNKRLEDREGECHRFPPTSMKYHVTHHQTVYGDGWCGEFKKRSRKVGLKRCIL